MAKGILRRTVRKFAQRLAQEVKLPYFFWDERLSSSAVENMMIKEADLSRSKRKKSLDAGAAAYHFAGCVGCV